MSSTIRLNDLLKLSDVEVANTKIKFNQNNGTEEPMELYLHDPELINSQWLFWRTKKRYFNVGEVAICFLKLKRNIWLLTTIKHVTKEYNIVNGINYEGNELSKFKGYYGRVIVKYHKSQSQMYNAKTILDDLEVLEVLSTLFDGEDFRGYEQVSLSFKQLEGIIKRRKKDWVAALENQKGVYLIVDKSNGKMYVGSAYGGNGMLLNRWSKYISNGHGGNSELAVVIRKYGIDHAISNFQFSILENYNARVDSRLILDREQWWKNVLQTRLYGYNSN